MRSSGSLNDPPNRLPPNPPRRPIVRLVSAGYIDLDFSAVFGAGMTEDEAKTKWCPFVRLGEGAHNRWSVEADPIGLVGASCVASACMAWRVTGRLFEVSQDDPRGVTGRAAGGDASYFDIDGPRRFLPKEGYCGLAGRPE